MQSSLGIRHLHSSIRNYANLMFLNKKKPIKQKKTTKCDSDFLIPETTKSTNPNGEERTADITIEKK